MSDKVFAGPETSFLPLVSNRIVSQCSRSGSRDLSRPHTSASMGVLIAVQCLGIDAVTARIEMEENAFKKEEHVGDTADYHEASQAPSLRARHRAAGVVEEVWNCVFEAILNCGGDILRFSEDRLMVLFAGDESLKRHLTRAYACAARCVLPVSIVSANSELAVTTIVASGLMHALHIGGFDATWEYIMAGPCVASLMELAGLAEQGSLVVPSETHELLGLAALVFKDTGIRCQEGASTIYRVSLDSISAVIEESYSVEELATSKRRELSAGEYASLVSHVRKDVVRWAELGDTLWLGAFNHVSVLSIMVSGWETPLTALRPPQVAALQAVVTAIQASAEEFHGCITEIGLAQNGALHCLAAFGLPPARPNASTAAVGAAKALMKVMRGEGFDKLAIRAGLGTGAVFTGFVGCERRREYFLSGAAVSKATLRMSLAPFGAVLLDSASQIGAKSSHLLDAYDTTHSIDDAPSTREVDPARISDSVPRTRAASKRPPMAVTYRVMFEWDNENRARPTSRPSSSAASNTNSSSATSWRVGVLPGRTESKPGPIVGRESILPRIATIMQDFVETPQATGVLFVGKRGVGKSALVAGCVAEAIRSGLTILRCSVNPAVVRPLQAYEKLVRQLFLQRYELNISAMWEDGERRAALGLMAPRDIPALDAMDMARFSADSSATGPPKKRKISAGDGSLGLKSGLAGKSPDVLQFISRIETQTVFRSHLARLSLPSSGAFKYNTKSDIRSAQINMIVEMLERMAATNGIVLVIDDAYLQDEASWELSMRLLKVEGVFMLLSSLDLETEVFEEHEASGAVDPFRRGSWEISKAYLSACRSLSCLRTFPVTGLVDKAARLLALSSLDADSAPDALTNMIVKRGAGSPLYMVEILQSLLESGTVYLRGSSIVLSQNVPVHLPSRVEQIFSLRIEALPPELRVTLMTAAVVGMCFTAEIVAKVHPECVPHKQVTHCLLLLEKLGWITEVMPSHSSLELLLAVADDRTTSMYNFTKSALREIAFEMVFAGKRKQIHQALAHLLRTYHSRLFEARLISSVTDESDELGIVSMLAYHLIAAKAPEQAREWLDKGATLMAEGGMPRSAAALYEHIIATSSTSVRTDELPLVNWYYRLGTCYAAAGKTTSAVEAFNSAATRAGSPLPAATMRRCELRTKLWLLGLKLRVTMTNRNVPEDVAKRHQIISRCMVMLQNYFLEGEADGTGKDDLRARFCTNAALLHSRLAGNQEVFARTTGSILNLRQRASVRPLADSEHSEHSSTSPAKAGSARRSSRVTPG